MKGTNQLKEGLLYVGIYLMMLLITIFVPAISIITMFVLPIPLLIYASRNGWGLSLIILAVVIPISIFLVSIYSLPFTIISGLGGIFLGSALYQKKSAYEAWALGAVGYIIGLVLTYLFSLLFFSYNWITEIEKMIDDSIAQSKELMQSINGEVPKEQVAILENQFNQIPSLLPSIMAIFAVIFAFITLWIGFKILNKQSNENYAFPPVRKLTFPKAVLWYYFIALIASFFELQQGSVWHDAVQNAYTFTGALITLQGFSFLFAYAHYKKYSVAVPIIGVVVTLVFSFLLLYPIRILGIIDMGFSLRERLSKK